MIPQTSAPRIGIPAVLLSLFLAGLGTTSSRAEGPYPAASVEAAPPLSDSDLDKKVRPAGLESVAPNQLSLVLSGYRRSQMDPCGCNTNKLGGLDREAKLVDRIRATSQPVLLADAGGYIREFTSEPDLKRAGYLLKALHDLGYRVVNVGYPDVLPGVDRLKAMAKDAGITLVSANLTDAAGKPLFEPFHIHEIALGDKPLKVAFVGSTRQRLPNSPSLQATNGAQGAQVPGPVQIQDPIERLKAVLPEARKQSDLVVLLHYGRRDTVPDMLNLLGPVSSNLDVVATGEWGGPFPVPTSSTLPLLSVSGYEGRQVSHAVLALDGNKRPSLAGVRLIEVTQNIPQVAAISQKMEEAKKAVMAAMPAPRVAIPAAPVRPQ